MGFVLWLEENFSLRLQQLAFVPSKTITAIADCVIAVADCTTATADYTFRVGNDKLSTAHIRL